MALRMILILAVASAGCLAEPEGEVFPDPEVEGEGVAYDDDRPYDNLELKADQERTYDVPDWAFDEASQLVEPEIIISLRGRSMHLFDRASEFSVVFPVGVGKRPGGVSLTPTGFFSTGDQRDGWWYVSDRNSPAYYGGFPFLRFTTLNTRNVNTYGAHGPVTFRCRTTGNYNDKSCPRDQRRWYLKRGDVSQGCIRMQPEDVVELFYRIRRHSRVPVTVQDEIEVAPNGDLIEVETDAAPDRNPQWSYERDDEIRYGELGVRPATWDPCEMPGDWPHSAYGCN